MWLSTTKSNIPTFMHSFSFEYRTLWNKIRIVQLLPKFLRMNIESPYLHLREFKKDALLSTFKILEPNNWSLSSSYSARRINLKRNYTPYARIQKKNGMRCKKKFLKNFFIMAHHSKHWIAESFSNIF